MSKETIEISQSGRVQLSETLLLAVMQTALDYAVEEELTVLWRNAYGALAAAADHLALMKHRLFIAPTERSRSE